MTGSVMPPEGVTIDGRQLDWGHWPANSYGHEAGPGIALERTKSIGEHQVVYKHLVITTPPSSGP